MEKLSQQNLVRTPENEHVDHPKKGPFQKEMFIFQPLIFMRLIFVLGGSKDWDELGEFY